MNSTKDLTWAKLTASILFETILGLMGGFICGMGGAVLLGVVYKINDPSFGDIIGALLGFGVVYTCTMPVIVYLTGTRLFKRRSSFWMVILASVCGELAVLTLAEPLRLNLKPQLLTISFLLVPLALTVITFNYGSTRRIIKKN
ncbi:MAG: hypothetical protein RI947_142 [Candidatus Parcubacteria bacterium]|jgi:hypothetical protein